MGFERTWHYNINDAITQAVRAGRLRAYVREHGGPGLGGLIRLANRHSDAATRCLTDVCHAVAADINAHLKGGLE